jgi:hypothetical protein
MSPLLQVLVIPERYPSCGELRLVGALVKFCRKNDDGRICSYM